jgi:HAD superfamily hydrolase (TIGR01450 family)
MKKEFENIKCFLLDMDGTIHLSGVVFDGAPDAIDRMRKQGKVFFITNSVWFTRTQQMEKFKNMGIDCTEDEIYTSANATADYLVANFKDKKVYVLGTSVLKQELRAAGVDVVEDAPDLVVVSFDDELNFKNLTKTCDFIRADIPFLSTHPDFNYPIKGGYLPDSGANLALIESCTGKKPFIVCGKPHEPLVSGVMRRVGCEKNEIAMFGDRLMTDIALANMNGLLAVLVLTGEATLQDHETSEFKADVILNSICEF